jgi:hypothetical protein
VEALHALESSGPLNARLGRNGRDFYRRDYDWPVIERKYLDVLRKLEEDDRGGRGRREMEALPGWLARRRPEIPAARAVLDRLPSGPVVTEDARR